MPPSFQNGSGATHHGPAPGTGGHLGAEPGPGPEAAGAADRRGGERGPRPGEVTTTAPPREAALLLCLRLLELQGVDATL